MEDLRVVTARDRMVASRFRDVAGELDVRRNRIGSALADLGTPWGAEVVGARFADGYLPAAETALWAARAVAGKLEDVAAVLAESLQRTEDDDRAVGEPFRAARSSVERDPG